MSLTFICKLKIDAFLHEVKHTGSWDYSSAKCGKYFNGTKMMLDVFQFILIQGSCYFT
jgi:hypothetical protein